MTQGLTGQRSVKYGAVCALILTFASAPAANARPQNTSGDASSSRSNTPAHHKTASTRTKKATHTTSGAKRLRRKKTVRGQKNIDSDRARAIQEVLIRENYLSGEATGIWNQDSEEAMRRYQGDHGWQTKEVPDSRALIKLGLGPSKDHLLNPKSAMTTAPDAQRTEATVPTSQTAAPVPTQPAQPRPSDPPSPQ